MPYLGIEKYLKLVQCVLKLIRCDCEPNTFCKKFSVFSGISQHLSCRYSDTPSLSVNDQHPHCRDFDTLCRDFDTTAVYGKPRGAVSLR